MISVMPKIDISVEQFFPINYFSEEKLNISFFMLIEWCLFRKQGNCIVS